MDKQIMEKELESELMLYDSEEDAVHILNPSARIIYRMKKQGKDLSEIEDRLRETFRLEECQDSRGDILRCLEELTEKGLI